MLARWQACCSNRRCQRERKGAGRSGSRRRGGWGEKRTAIILPRSQTYHQMESAGELEIAFDGTSPRGATTARSLSPTTDAGGPSPVTDLSCALRGLRCRDAQNTRRRLRLTPGPVYRSPPEPKRDRNSIQTPPEEEETPTRSGKEQRVSTDRRRGQRILSPVSHRILSPGSSSPKMKRLRVKLSSRFACSAGEVEPSAACTVLQRPLEGDVELQNIQALRSLRRVKSRAFSPSFLDMGDQSLTGDFSKPLLLPVERVEHQNLHCISAQTVAALLRGQYRDTVEDFLVVDCRYPYEYQGGHIKGAVNLHTEAQMEGALLQVPALVRLSPWGRTPTGSPPAGAELQTGSRTPSRRGSPAAEGSSPRKLVVFHCEFSTERGPRLCRYLRELDRALHSSVYPLLLYPEIYLLDRGYTHFYRRYPDQCEPRGYVPMLRGDYRRPGSRLRRRPRPPDAPAAALIGRTGR